MFLIYSRLNCKDHVSDKEFISGLHHSHQPPTDQHSTPIDPLKLERRVII